MGAMLALIVTLAKRFTDNAEQFGRAGCSRGARSSVNSSVPD
jgi:hypothetical protein